MLGLICDKGAPDTIPWRVQVAIDRSLRELGSSQLRIVALASILGMSARHALLSSALQLDAATFISSLDELESAVGRAAQRLERFGVVERELLAPEVLRYRTRHGRTV